MKERGWEQGRTNCYHHNAGQKGGQINSKTQIKKAHKKSLPLSKLVALFDRDNLFLSWNRARIKECTWRSLKRCVILTCLWFPWTFLWALWFLGYHYMPQNGYKAGLLPAKPDCHFSIHHPLWSLFLLSWTLQTTSVWTTQWLNSSIRQAKAKIYSISQMMAHVGRPQAVQLLLCTDVLQPWLVAVPQLTLNPGPSTIKTS